MMSGIHESSIMIVEDNSTLQHTIMDLLETHGYHNIHAFNDGFNAIRNFQTQSPDLVILDVEMPGMSGLDILVQFKRLRPRLPVVMMSSHHDRHILLRACESGASTIFPKPFDTAHFCRKIENLLNNINFFNM